MFGLPLGGFLIAMVIAFSIIMIVFAVAMCRMRKSVTNKSSCMDTSTSTDKQPFKKDK